MDTTIQDIMAIIRSEEVREFWMLVGGITATLGSVAVAAVAMWKSGAWKALQRVRAYVATHPIEASVLFPMVVALVVYAAEKSNVVIPRQEQCDFRQSAAASVSGNVEYYRSTSTTNLNVALWSGTSTQELSFVANDFLYAYDTSTGGGPKTPAQSPFWVRDYQSNDWIRAEMRTNVTSGTKAAVVAYLPSSAIYGVDPESYRYWFIGPQEYLPEVIIEGGVGIKIDQVVITSSSVYVKYHPEDPDLATGSHTYVLQCRISRDGLLGEWQNIATSVSTGIAGGSFLVNVYSVGEYREYRVYADKGNE